MFVNQERRALGSAADLLSLHDAEALKIEFCLKQVGCPWACEKAMLVQEEVTKMQGSSWILWDSQGLQGQTTGPKPGY